MFTANILLILLDLNSKVGHVRSQQQHNLLQQFKIPKIHAQPKCTDQKPRHKHGHIIEWTPDSKIEAIHSYVNTQ